MGDLHRYRDGTAMGLSLSIPIGFFGAAFGAISSHAGLDGIVAVAMSATTFSAAAQFAVVSVLLSGGDAVAAAWTGILLNSRCLAIGLAIAPSLTGGIVTRAVQAMLVVDESWALATAAGRLRADTLVAAGAVLWITWVTSTALGVLSQNVLADPMSLGFDAALAALLIWSLGTLLSDARARLVAGGSVGVAIVLAPVALPGLPMAAAAFVALIVAFVDE